MGEITLGGTVGLVTFVGVLVGIVGVVTVERSSGDPIVKLPGIRRSRFLP